MKKGVFSIVLALGFGATTLATEPVKDETKQVDTQQSQVTWKGYKVGGEHEGNLNLKTGNLVFDKKGKLSGGEFVVDMSSLVVTDLQGEYKGKLEAHLKSDDFFSVAAHPTAKLVFSSAKSMKKNTYTVDGNLTIKGITKPITFVISFFDDNKATATVKVDRTKYDITFKSGIIGTAKDKLIYDDFDLVVNLKY